MHSSNEPHTNPTHELERETTTAPRAGLSRWIVVLAAVALVAGPLLGGGLHHERARWLIAAGLEQWLDGDLEAALAKLEQAAEIAPDYSRVYELRAQWRIFAEDYAGALEDADRVLQLSPDNFSGYRLKADALVYLDREEEAAKAWLDYANPEKEKYGATQASTLNGLAYYRALANRDLGEALRDVNRAIELLGPDPALLDTRGYVRYRRGDYRTALDDMNPAVNIVERHLQAQRREARTSVGLSIQDPRATEKALNLLDRNVAVIRYHRGLLLEAMGRQAAAERDYRRVRELGFEPGPHLF